MLKMIVQAHRKPGLTDAAFYRRWQEDHGNLVKRLATDMGWRRYVQSHRLSEPVVDEFAERHGWHPPTSDGLAELWWDDGQAMERALHSTAGALASRQLETDEREFTDTSKLSALLAIETVVVGTPPPRPRRAAAVKVVVEFRRDARLSVASFQQLWNANYVPVIVRNAALLGLSAYVANMVDITNAFDFAKERGWRAAPDVVAELWWPNLEAMRAALSSRHALIASDALVAAEAAIIESSLTSAYAAKEHSILDMSGEQD